MTSGGVGMAVPPEVVATRTVEWTAAAADPELVGSLGRLDEADAVEVGVWGEKLVALMLTRAHAAAETGFSVRWMNAEGERGLPHDIEIASGDTIDSYIEVKTTRSEEKPVFEVSLAELDHARISRSAFVIYRVSGARSEGARVASLRNPAQHLGAGLSLLMAQR